MGKSGCLNDMSENVISNINVICFIMFFLGFNCIKMVKDRLGHDTRYALNCNKYKKEFGKIITQNFKKYYE